MTATDPNENPAEETVEGDDEASAVGEEGGSTVNRRRRRRGLPVQTIVVIGLLVAAFGYTGWSMLHNATTPKSRLARGPNVNGTPAGPEQAQSERYQNSVETANRAGADRAVANGSSFIATPDQSLHAVDQARQQTPQHKVEMPVAPANKRHETHTAHIAPPPKPRQRSQPRDFSDINKLAARMKVQAAGLTKQWAPHASAKTVVLREKLYRTPEQREAAALAARQAALANRPAGERDMLAKAGHFVFARTLNGSDSDTPGPVVAEIFQHGPLYHARLIGKFTKNRNTNALIVRFRQLVLPNGDEIPVSAYAVDGEHGSIAVRSGIDRRYLQRYGPLLAGAFIAGLGQTLSEPSESIVVGNNTTTVVTEKQRLKEALYAGAGQVGERMASDISRSAPKGPLVKLDAGYTIGVLFMKGVPAPDGMTVADQ